MHALSRRPQGEAGEVRWERGDLTDEAAARDLVRRVRPDVVVHLASEVSGGRDLELVLPMLRANLVATVNVMLACAEAGCSRLVLAGSMEEPDLGDAEAVAQSPYAVAKWSALAYARHLHALHDLPVVHLRVFMVYGPGQRDLRKFVPYVTVSLLRGQAPKLTSGERGVDWVYVDDVVDAFLRAVRRCPDWRGRRWTSGRGALTTARDLARPTARADRGRRRARLRGDPGSAARTRPGGGARRRGRGDGLATADAPRRRPVPGPLPTTAPGSTNCRRFRPGPGTRPKPSA